MRLNPYSPLAKGLIGWWPLASDARDYSLFSRQVGDASSGAAPSTIGGRRCYSFDGSSHYVTAGDYDYYSPASVSNGSMSITAWVWKSSSVGSGDTHTIVSKYHDVSPFTAEWYFAIDATEMMFFQILDGSAVKRLRMDTDVTLANERWYLCGVTLAAGHSVDEDITLYLDGVPVASTGFGQDGSFVISDNTTSPLDIGDGLRNHSFDAALHGGIADVRFYNCGLSAAQHYQTWDETVNGGFGSLARSHDPIWSPPASSVMNPYYYQMLLAGGAA